jgi:hypothetical protein
VAQRLKQQRMAVRVVQTIETAPDVGKKTGEIGPWRGRLQQRWHHQLWIIAQLCIALVSEQAPGLFTVQWY